MKDITGTASSEYALVITVVTLSLGGGLALFSDEIQETVCKTSEAALSVSTGENVTLDCAGSSNAGGTETASVPEPEDPNPSDVTRFGARSGDDPYVPQNQNGFVVMPLNYDQRFAAQYVDDKNISETRYTEFVPNSDLLNCDFVYCAGEISGLPVDSSDKYIFDSNGHQVNYGMLSAGGGFENLNVGFRNYSDNSEQLILSPYKSVSVDGGGSKSIFRAVENYSSSDPYMMQAIRYETELYNGDFFADNFDRVLHVPSDKANGNVVRISSNEASNQIVSPTIEPLPGYSFNCSASSSVAGADIIDGRSFAGFDQITAIAPNGARTEFKMYHDSLSDLEFLGIDEQCDPKSTDYRYLRYFRTFPDNGENETLVYNHYKEVDGFEGAIVKWNSDLESVGLYNSKTNTNSIVPGSPSLSVSRKLAFRWGHDSIKNNTCQESRCNISIVGMENEVSPGVTENLEIDANGANLFIVGGGAGEYNLNSAFYPADWNLTFKNLNEYAYVPINRYGNPTSPNASSNMSFTIDAGGKRVHLNPSGFFEGVTQQDLEFTLKNGEFVVDQSHNRSKKFIPVSLDEDTVIHVHNDIGSFLTVINEQRDANYIASDHPDAGDYTWYCRGIEEDGITDFYRGHDQDMAIDKHYDEIQGVATDGTTLTYRFYSDFYHYDGNNRPEQLEFFGEDGLCTENQIETSRYFNRENDPTLQVFFQPVD